MQIDPITHITNDSDSMILSAQLSSGGEKPDRINYTTNFRDECFVVSESVGGYAHGDTACRLAGDTAVWGYKLIRQRRFYWADKKLLLKRIFRSVNISVWQKKRETGFETGLATTLAVAVIGTKNIWIGSAGDICVYHIRAGRIIFRTQPDIDQNGDLTKIIGIQRFGLVPQVHVDQFISEDILVLATNGVSGFFNAEEIVLFTRGLPGAPGEPDRIAGMLIGEARARGSRENAAVCTIIRR